MTKCATMFYNNRCLDMFLCQEALNFGDDFSNVTSDIIAALKHTSSLHIVVVRGAPKQISVPLVD